MLAGIQGGVAILLATGSSADLEAVLDLLLSQLRTAEDVAGTSRNGRRQLLESSR